MTDYLPIILDASVVLILGFCIFFYGRKGFAESLLGTLRLVLCVVLTWALQPTVAGWLKDWGLTQAIADKLVLMFDGKLKQTVAETCTNIIAFLGLLLMLLIALRFVILALRLVTKLPIIHGANHLLGAVFGLIIGIFSVWVFGTLISLAGMLGWFGDGTAPLERCVILPIFQQYNLILTLLP